MFYKFYLLVALFSKHLFAGPAAIVSLIWTHAAPRAAKVLYLLCVGCSRSTNYVVRFLLRIGVGLVIIPTFPHFLVARWPPPRSTNSIAYSLEAHRRPLAGWFLLCTRTTYQPSYRGNAFLEVLPRWQSISWDPVAKSELEVPTNSSTLLVRPTRL